MIEKGILRKVYFLYRFLLFSITFAIFIHMHPGNMDYSAVFFGYLLDTVLLLIITSKYFDFFSLGVDVAFAYFLAWILSIKELIAFSIVPLFVSCLIVPFYLSSILLVLSSLIVFLYSNINSIFAWIAYAASFTSSCLLRSSLKQKQIARKREEFNREFEEKLSIAKRLSLEFAHEIRNPLMAISGAIEMLKNAEDEKTREKMIELAEKEIEKANNLTRDFLNLEKPGAFLKERFELCGVIEELIDSFSHLAKIEVNCESVPVVLDGDRSMIIKMLNNMIKNSIEAKATRININVFRKENLITIIIEDNGVGINLDSEEIDKIFLPFFTTKQQGSGLGLSICKQVAEAHGGYIEVNGKNSFKIVLQGEKGG